MVKTIQNFCSIIFYTAFFVCVNHCMLEQASGVDLHPAEKCASEHSEDQSKHHHHDSPCENVVTLTNKTNVSVGNIILNVPVLSHFKFSFYFVGLQDNFSPNISLKSGKIPIPLLNDLSLAPNAPPFLS
jgi:hypothetical protein